MRHGCGLCGSRESTRRSRGWIPPCADTPFLPCPAFLPSRERKRAGPAALPSPAANGLARSLTVAARIRSRLGCWRGGCSGRCFGAWIAQRGNAPSLPCPASLPSRERKRAGPTAYPSPTVNALTRSLTVAARIRSRLGWGRGGRSGRCFSAWTTRRDNAPSLPCPASLPSRERERAGPTAYPSPAVDALARSLTVAARIRSRLGCWRGGCSGRRFSAWMARRGNAPSLPCPASLPSRERTSGAQAPAPTTSSPVNRAGNALLGRALSPALKRRAGRALSPVNRAWMGAGEPLTESVGARRASRPYQPGASAPGRGPYPNRLSVGPSEGFPRLRSQDRRHLARPVTHSS